MPQTAIKHVIKYSILPGLILMFSHFVSIAQVQNGKRALTTFLAFFSLDRSKSISRIELNPRSSVWTQFTNAGIDFTIGKITNNSLLGYGIHSSLVATKSDDGSNYHSLGIGPVINYIKYFPVTSQVFLSPFVRLSPIYVSAETDSRVSGYYDVRRGFTGLLEASPFACVFKIKDNAGFLFSLGTIRLNYSVLKVKGVDDSVNIRRSYKSMGIYGELDVIVFGVQKTF